MRSISKMLMVPAFAAAAALATFSAQAENIKVPFNFTAAGKLFPAGTYTVQASLYNNMVSLQSADGSRNFSWIVGPGDPSPSDRRVVLQFDRTDEAPMLRTIQYHGQITTRLDRNARHGHERPVEITAGQ